MASAENKRSCSRVSIGLFMGELPTRVVFFSTCIWLCNPSPPPPPSPLVICTSSVVEWKKKMMWISLIYTTCQISPREIVSKNEFLLEDIVIKKLKPAQWPYEELQLEVPISVVLGGYSTPVSGSCSTEPTICEFIGVFFQFLSQRVHFLVNE